MLSREVGVEIIKSIYEKSKINNNELLIKLCEELLKVCEKNS